MWQLDGLDPGDALSDPRRHPATTWFREHHELMRDAAHRGYSTKWITYECAVCEPETVANDVLVWLGVGGHARDASRAIQSPSARTALNRR
jgi:hypothetical protein